MDLQKKLKVDGTVKKFKARLVIHGFKQKSEIDYFDNYAPVESISTTRLLIAMALIPNLIIHQMDMKTAFLNGDLDEEEANVILGIRIKHESNGIAIYQSQYIENVLKKFNYFDCILVSNAMDTSENLMPNNAADKKAEWLKNLLLKILLWSKPITYIFVRCDSAATLAKAYSQMYNEQSRHLGVRHNTICELITNGMVSIEFVRS
nr:zinc finger, CCHC-type [Tanacetum cinerariifolium]